MENVNTENPVETLKRTLFRAFTFARLNETDDELFPVYWAVQRERPIVSIEDGLPSLGTLLNEDIARLRTVLNELMSWDELIRLRIFLNRSQWAVFSVAIPLPIQMDAFPISALPTDPTGFPRGRIGFHVNDGMSPLSLIGYYDTRQPVENTASKSIVEEN